MDKEYFEYIYSAQNGDKKALEELIKRNKGLIWSIVKRFLDRGHEAEDLYQIAIIGFIKCIKKFDTSYDVKLTTYAVPYIMGEIKRFIRDDGLIRVSRGIKELGFKIKELQNRYYNQNGHEISISQIAKELKISREEVASALEALSPIESIYDEAYSNGDGKISKIDQISSKIDEEKLIVDKIALQELLNRLNDSEKKVIILRFFRSKTQSQVAKILGVSQVQVSRIERKILKNMKDKLRA